MALSRNKNPHQVRWIPQEKWASTEGIVASTFLGCTYGTHVLSLMYCRRSMNNQQDVHLYFCTVPRTML